MRVVGCGLIDRWEPVLTGSCVLDRIVRGRKLSLEQRLSGTVVSQRKETTSRGS